MKSMIYLKNTESRDAFLKVFRLLYRLNVIKGPTYYSTEVYIYIITTDWRG